ncbi:MAG: intradiol ring-cleavage dioxygenase [Proteobacteria bacterium]|nr:intradiol ring-cleavage dioxygenase [Pseudomonadota bacterium]
MVVNRRFILKVGLGMTAMSLFKLKPMNILASSGELHRTPSASEGPYWKSGSPLRKTLYQPGDSGQRITVVGKVLDSVGNPIKGAKVDIWQADAGGNYDNRGFDYRGHVLSDAQGGYGFNTVKPGIYPSRTPHIHIKISTPEGRDLTTQLYFPDYSRRNERDFLFDKRLLVTWESESQARFDFVL